MPILRENIPNAFKKESAYLLESARNVRSQFGEDGVIEKIFQIIGEGDRWCVEFGAWDGRHLSNTCHLIEDRGWYGVQIEGSRAKFAQLRENFAGNDRVRQLNRMVGFERGVDSLDDILRETEIARGFDLISIDVDGNDYYVWESMRDYRPRVVVIEFNPRIPNRVVFVQDRDLSINQGCSAAALVELGKQKKYELVCALRCNLVFVREEEFPRFGIADNSLEALRRDVGGSIFCGYDGTIYNTLGQLGWRHRRVKVAPDGLQLVPKAKRVFNDRVVDHEDAVT
jgi:hypothetical protein